jgi:hypothetical protein
LYSRTFIWTCFRFVSRRYFELVASRAKPI